MFFSLMFFFAAAGCPPVSLTQGLKRYNCQELRTRVHDPDELLWHIDQVFLSLGLKKNYGG